MTDRVYIISIYEEDGAEGVRATLDKTKVESLLVTHPILGKDQCAEEITHLRDFLEKDVPGKFDLSRGWGGFQLHIVELE